MIGAVAVVGLPSRADDRAEGDRPRQWKAVDWATDLIS
jgi:hypothetical protein